MGAVAAVRILHRRRLAEVPADVRGEVEQELAVEHEKLAGGLVRAQEIGVVDEIVEPAPHPVGPGGRDRRRPRHPRRPRQHPPLTDHAPGRPRRMEPGAGGRGPARRPGGRSDDLVEPADGGAVAGVPEGLELVVPGLAEQRLHLRRPRRWPGPWPLGPARRAAGPRGPRCRRARRSSRGTGRASGVQDHRSPSAPALGSSVTSKRSCDQSRRAEASRDPVPGSACHDSSARTAPGEAGCGVQSRVTRTSRTAPTAHSTCGHSAGGAEWTYTTPRVATGSSLLDVRCAFPSGLTVRGTVARGVRDDDDTLVTPAPAPPHARPIEAPRTLGRTVVKSGRRRADRTTGRAPCPCRDEGLNRAQPRAADGRGVRRRRRVRGDPAGGDHPGGVGPGGPRRAGPARRPERRGVAVRAVAVEPVRPALGGLRLARRRGADRHDPGRLRDPHPVRDHDLPRHGDAVRHRPGLDRHLACATRPSGSATSTWRAARGPR